MWIARDKYGSLRVYYEKPEKYGSFYLCDVDNGMWLDRNQFPEVTFENSPQEVELKLVNVKEGKTIDLQKAFIEKACEWLDDTDFDMEYWNSENGFSKEEFIEDFKKAMEE